MNASLLLGADLISAVGGVHLEYDKHRKLCAVHFGEAKAPVTAAVSTPRPDCHPSYGVEVESDGDGVILRTADSEVQWDSSTHKWIMSWKWKDGTPNRNLSVSASANIHVST